MNLTTLRQKIWRPSKSLLQSLRESRAERLSKKNARADATARCTERLTRVQFGADIHMTTKATPEIERLLNWAHSDEGVAYSAEEYAKVREYSRARAA